MATLTMLVVLLLLILDGGDRLAEWAAREVDDRNRKDLNKTGGAQ
jgi:hypothetical protein